MGTTEFLLLLAFPILLAIPVLAVRYFGSWLVRQSGADRSIVVPAAQTVRESLPMICAKTGTKAHGIAEEQSEQLKPVWLLLLLLGPAGIVALALIWAVRGRGGVRIDIPLSDTALQHIQRTAKTSSAMAAVAGATVIGFAIALAADIAGGVQAAIGAIVIVALCGWMYASTTARMSRVRLRSAGSNSAGSQTLVHLDGVHADFVAAVQADARAKGLL